MEISDYKWFKCSRIFSLFLLACVFSGSCQKVKDSDLGQIEGTIYCNNLPVYLAQITVDDRSDNTYSSDERGYFRIQGIKSGTHRLFIQKTLEQGNILERNISVDLTNNISLDSIILPKPVVLFTPFDNQAQSMRLKWSQSEAPDFYEYKLYRKKDPGIDETTGELVFVGTNRSDTTYTDINLITGSTYYYRVFVRNMYGRLGGSNISSGTTKAGNLIENGNFELPDISNYWNLQTDDKVGYVLRQTDSTMIEGNFALLFKYPVVVNYQWAWAIITYYKPLILEPNRSYKISCWVKGKGGQGDIGGTTIRLIQNGNYYYNLVLLPEQLPYGYNGNKIDIDWTLRSGLFYITDPAPVTVKIFLTHENVWLDDFQIIPQ